MCNIRLNDDEWKHLTTAARSTRTSLPAYLVRAGLAAADDSENTAAAIAGHRELVTELFAARRHLGQVGNNLNQVTRALNSGGQPAEDEQHRGTEIHRQIGVPQDVAGPSEDHTEGLAACQPQLAGAVHAVSDRALRSRPPRSRPGREPDREQPTSSPPCISRRSPRRCRPAGREHRSTATSSC
ncbi:MobC family plasmid mobilization relaxosome protein [Streptomyces sp. SF28]|nr:MobC family plasmid mobilization relaxosome protein [Streptomyces pinistramenti]